jgi:hypothetical protein
MKKVLLLFAIVALSAMQSFAQDSKFYIGIGAGYATAGGDLDGLKGGVSLNFLNLGYRLNETFGITANLSSTGHAIDGFDDAAFGIGTFSAGPMVSFSLSDKVSWDLKPQYAFTMKGVFAGDDLGLLDAVEYTGNAFIFANSLVFGDGGSGFDFSIDLDYLAGKFTEGSAVGQEFDLEELVGEILKVNNFKIGVGLRYNF